MRTTLSPPLLTVGPNGVVVSNDGQHAVFVAVMWDQGISGDTWSRDALRGYPRPRAVFPLVLASPERPPMPESLLVESVTDVDSREAGELEYEANVASLGARSGGARAAITSFEVEWRLLRELGLRLEPSYARVVGTGGSPAEDRFGLAGGLAVGLLHDFAHDAHLQLELLGRTPDDAGRLPFEPGEAELPVSLDAVSAIRRGPLTVRATVGAEAGGAFAHAPVHTDGALLLPFSGEGRFGFFGLEIRADWARPAPLLLAPDVVALVTPLGLPFSLSLALPFQVGAGATDVSYGVFMRLMLMTSRELEYGRQGK